MLGQSVSEENDKTVKEETMDTSIQSALRLSVQKFHMPRYHELPNVGLYLEQVAKYVNNVLSPLNCAEITTSMISNYVKKGFIPSPQKKQYDADRVVYILFTAVAKNVLALEDIVELINMQKQKYSLAVAYDYFCSELENMLAFVVGLKDEPEKNIGVTEETAEKALLRNVITSVSHSLYLTATFAALKAARKGNGK